VSNVIRSIEAKLTFNFEDDGLVGFPAYYQRMAWMDEDMAMRGALGGHNCMSSMSR
jgi:hypothetical protein